jgi:LacI family transcriptional regulator
LSTLSAKGAQGPTLNGSQRKKVTIRQIAEVANVSLSTVSRALRNDPRANRDTVERVLRVAKELNYYPDSLAKGLRQNKTNTIGIIFNDLNNPFYSEVLGVIGAALNRGSYSMIISYSHYDAAQERANIVSMLSKRVDGIILSPINDQTENVRLLEENGIAYVLIDCYPHFPGTAYVYSDHGMGARMATEHLISRGHRDILLLTGPPTRCMAGYFIDNYRRTLQESGIPVREELIVHADDLSIDSGYQTFKKLLTGSSEYPNLEFTAVVTISDLLAIGIYKLANELKFRIPDDYSVIGYDNVEIASVLSPPLTTIHQPRKRIGIESLAMLLHKIENGSAENRSVVFPPHLVRRGSVRSLA